MTQLEALAILKTGVNIFLTGEPGAGKSYTIRQYVNFLRSSAIDPAITASTGIAATHIGGMTLHSWSGIGISKSMNAGELKELANKDRLAKRIKATQVLIIDEISMFEGQTLNLVDAVCKVIKQNEEPFGGMQIIFVGDFFQLPPVSRSGDPTPQFAFSSAAWLAADPVICYLSEQHRQEDETFLEILSALRRGTINDDHKALLSSRQATFVDDSFSEMTKLYSHNVDVDRMNTQALAQLDTDPRTYRMHAYGAPPLIDQLKRGCLSPELLELKLGARVMFTKNSSDGSYVNGTTGEVSAFSKENGYPIVKLRSGRQVEAATTEWKIEAEGKSVAAIVQIPLRLAWAMTVHKSQGMSLDAALIDLSSAFAYGQGYVALSRVRSLSGLHLKGLNQRALEVDPTVLAQDETFRQRSLEARDTLAALTEEHLKKAHEEFIVTRGGSLSGGGFVGRPKAVQKKAKRYEQTLALVVGGMTIAEAANERSRTEFTIFEHLEELRDLKVLPLDKLGHLIAGKEDDVKLIQAKFKQLDTQLLKPVHEHFKGEHSYDVIRLARLFIPVNH
ncbi:MAG: AAA family ATPase [Patescibacteria group bacterium]